MYQLKTETTYVLEYHELDEIINKEFPLLKDFECVADQEWSNDQSHTISLKKEKLNKWGEETIERANRGVYKQYALWELVQDLVNRDILPEGDYRIDISW